MTGDAAAATDATRLGRAAAGRLRLPGTAARPAQRQVGVLARSVGRFANGVSRPADVRVALRGPGLSAGDMRPPRWWTPMPQGAADQSVDEPAGGSADGSAGRSADGSAGGSADGSAGGAGAARRLSSEPANDSANGAGAPAPWLRDTRPVAAGALPGRGLPRAARVVEDEQSYTPGGMLTNLTSVEARVRRHAEVTASGPMLTQADRQKLTAVRRRPAEEPAAPAPPIRRSPTRSASSPTPGSPAGSPAGAPSTSSAPSTSAATAVSSPMSWSAPSASAITPVDTATSAGGPAAPTTPTTPTALPGPRAPWSLAATPTRFARSLGARSPGGRSPGARPLPTRSAPLAQLGATTAPTPSALAPATPIRAASVGLLDRAPALPGSLLFATRGDTTPAATPLPSSATAAPRPAAPTSSSAPTSLPASAAASAATSASAAASAPAPTAPPSVAADSPVARAASAGSDPATSRPGPDGPRVPSTTVRRHARRGTRPASPAPESAIAMPDQLVIRRWTRHGRRNTALATGFGADVPIRPATAGALRTAAPPAGGSAATPAAPPAPPAPQPAPFATAPWVAAAPSGSPTPVPAPTASPAAAPTAIPAATPATPSAPMPWVPASRPGDAVAPDQPAAVAVAPAPAFGGAWAPAPGDQPRAGTSTPSAGPAPASSGPVSIGRRGRPALAGPPVPAAASAVTAAPAASAPPDPGTTGPASTALLRSLPVAPPRTGPVSRDASAAPASPMRPGAPSSSAPALPVLPSPPGRPAIPAPYGTPGAPATFTAADIERIRSGTGSLLERTADLFAAAGPAATPGTGSAVSPSLSPAPGRELDRTTGGPAVFHPTSTDSHALAASRPDPWRGGVPDPWVETPDEAEPTGATLDRIVDAVVERIEDRVIDELERRGRHEWRVV